MSATGESSSDSFSSASEAFAFTSGNPRIEETRGLMHLFRQDPILPVDRKPLVCVYGVPNHMTYADFCQFCGSFLQHVLEMRTVRNDGVEDKYSILMSFDSQDSADGFYKHFNGRRFSSLEDESCQVLFTVDIQYTGGSFENAQASSTASSIEHPSCPVCLERLDQDSGGILTTICNHSFHCSCISKWTDSSCPVCRYCQQQPEKSICFICETSENLWICVICGFVGCGRYKEGHAITHWKETQHCYSLEVETQRVWDYVGDNYVHRLIQSKTDGKLIELNSPHCAHAADGCGSCECSEDSEISEALLKSRVDAIVNEYNELLTTQLENQKIYFESLLHEVNKETERQIFEAVYRAVALKLQKMQAKLDKCIEEKKFLDDINENLLRNQGIWKAKVMEAEEREKRTLKLKDDRIKELEGQLRDLMLQMEVGSAIDEPSVSNEVMGGTVLPIQTDSASGNSDKRGSKTNSRRRNQGDKEVQTQLGLKSKEVMELEKKVIVGTYARVPVVLSSGKGCNLYDCEGKEYLDMTSGIAVNALGHCDPDWLKAVIDQAHVLAHVSNVYYSLPQVELAKLLVACSFADRVFFCNSGTEANEAAIKFARKFQKFSHPDEKQPAIEFISFSNSFHGRTMGALALTSKENYRTPFQPVMPGVTFLEYGNIEAAKEVIQRGKTAAVFVEPIQGEGGIYSATKEFLQALRIACDKAGSLLVFDEVQCGLGRTGYLWAHEAYNVIPDMMTLAKPLAGGLPIGAVLVSEKVASAINYGDHGSTFAGGPLICNAAIAVLKKISSPTFLADVSRKGKDFKELLMQKLGKNQHVREVRGMGLIIGIDLDVPANPLVDACRNSGLLVLTAGKGNVVRLVPPLTISEQELGHAAEVLSMCMPVLDASS